MCTVYCIGSHQQQHKILEKYQVITLFRVQGSSRQLTLAKR